MATEAPLFGPGKKKAKLENEAMERALAAQRLEQFLSTVSDVVDPTGEAGPTAAQAAFQAVAGSPEALRDLGSLIGTGAPVAARPAHDPSQDGVGGGTSFDVTDPSAGSFTIEDLMMGLGAEASPTIDISNLVPPETFTRVNFGKASRGERGEVAQDTARTASTAQATGQNFGATPLTFAQRQDLLTNDEQAEILRTEGGIKVSADTAYRGEVALGIDKARRELQASEGSADRDARADLMDRRTTADLAVARIRADAQGKLAAASANNPLQALDQLKKIGDVTEHRKGLQDTRDLLIANVGRARGIITENAGEMVKLAISIGIVEPGTQVTGETLMDIPLFHDPLDPNSNLVPEIEGLDPGAIAAFFSDPDLNTFRGGFTLRMLEDLLQAQEEELAAFEANIVKLGGLGVLGTPTSRTGTSAQEPSGASANQQLLDKALAEIERRKAVAATATDRALSSARGTGE